MSDGVLQLQEAVALMLAQRPGIDRKLAALLDPTRPLTAEELCERWGITAETPELQLAYLRRKARKWGLEALDGSDGWQALYTRGDVLHAEAFAARSRTRRKTKPKAGRKAA